MSTGKVSKKEQKNQMTLLGLVLMLLILPLMAVACGGENSAAPQGLQGPALIMFYTDN